MTAIPSDEVDESTDDNNEFETDELKTTSSVVLDDSDSSVVDYYDTDTETDEDSGSHDDEDFEFIEHDELWFVGFEWNRILLNWLYS